MKPKNWTALYLMFCVIGAGLEWCYGVLWDMVGTTPWIYPDSPLHYTSFEGIPLWGFGGLICVSVYQAFSKRKVRPLTGLVISLVLAAAWIALIA